MSRLSPLIVRRVGPLAPALPFPDIAQVANPDASVCLDDLKLFATGWIGGLVFFGTLFG